jgi:hypothetical protein
VTLYRLGCGMTAPEFSANHAHEMGCYQAVSPDYDAAARVLLTHNPDARIGGMTLDDIRQIIAAALHQP